MENGFRSPFKDAVDTAKSWSDQKGNLGSDAAAPSNSKTGELPGQNITQAGLPINSLKHGTPDSGNAHQG